MNSERSINAYIQAFCITPCEKKITNLSKNQSRFLDDYSTQINVNDDILRYNDKKLKKHYELLKKIMYKYSIDSFDLNNLIHNYDKSNPTLKFIKHFIKINNTKLLISFMKKNAWKKFVNHLTLFSNKLFNHKFKQNTVENCILKLMKKYINHVDGFWTTITHHEDSILMIEPMDMHYFIKCMHKTSLIKQIDYKFIETKQYNKI